MIGVIRSRGIKVLTAGIVAALSSLALASVIVEESHEDESRQSGSADFQFLLDGIVTAGTQALVRAVGVDYLGEIDDSGEVASELRVTEVLWQDTMESSEWTPVGDVGPVLVFDSEEPAWIAAMDSTEEQFLVGLGSRGEKAGETYAASFVMRTEGDDGTFVHPDTPFLQYQLDAYMDWGGNPFEKGRVEDLLVAWNIEASASAHPSAAGSTVNEATRGVTGSDLIAPMSDIGPIQLSWNQFVQDVLFGTQSWTDTPPGERSIQDAPDSLLETMEYVEVWVSVPDAWKVFLDGAICLRTPQADQGCTHTSTAEEGHLVPLELWIVPGEDVSVELRRLEPGFEEPVADITGGIEVARIPGALAAQSEILILQLNPALAPASVEDVFEDPPEVPLGQAIAVTEAQLQALLEEEPTAEPLPCDDCE